MFHRKKSLVGLDLGSQVLKAVEITLDGDEPVLSGFAQVEVPAGGDRAEALAELLREGKFSTKNVATSVAGQSVVVRYISMVEMADAELRQAIRYELDKYVPFEPDEVQIDCQRLSRRPHGTDEGGAQKQMTVVLTACRNSTLDQQLDDVVRMGLTPVAVDIDAFAVSNAWELCGRLTGTVDDRTLALIDVGATRAQINVVSAGETCFSREIAIGGSDMTQAVGRRLGLEVAEAEAVKRLPGEREADVEHAIATVLEDLVSETSLSLDYVENREGLGVEEVLLSGGAAQAPGVVDFLTRNAGRTARLWSPIAGLRLREDRVSAEKLEQAAGSLAVAVGLASRVRAA